MSAVSLPKLNNCLLHRVILGMRACEEDATKTPSGFCVRDSPEYRYHTDSDTGGDEGPLKVAH